MENFILKARSQVEDGQIGHLTLQSFWVPMWLGWEGWNEVICPKHVRFFSQGIPEPDVTSRHTPLHSQVKKKTVLKLQPQIKYYSATK